MKCGARLVRQGHMARVGQLVTKGNILFWYFEKLSPHNREVTFGNRLGELSVLYDSRKIIVLFSCQVKEKEI